MKKLVLIGAVLLLVITAGLIGCSEDSADATDEIPTIKWVQIGNGMPTNYDAWQEHVNAYLVEKIGVKVDVEVISWGDFKTRRSVMVNTNENYDIMFTAQDNYMNDISIGAHADITEKVKTVTPELYNMIPQAYWDAVAVDGVIYGVPTYKDSSFTNYFVWVQDYVDKYNIPVEEITTFAAATPYLEQIKEAEGIAPYILAVDAPSPEGELYDAFGTGLNPIGVAYTDESRRVVATCEQPDVLEQLEVLHEWYNKGIINSDAPTLPEAPHYRVLKIAQGWSTAAQTVWGPNMGAEAVAIQRSTTVLSNETVRGSISCINANSQNIDKSLELLQLINTDSYVRDAFFYGLEGDNFEYTENGRVHKLNHEWPMAGYCQATFFNVSLLDTDTVDQWAEVKELNANAVPSVMLGFTPDIEPFEDILANCVVIYNKYKLQLITGAGEPHATVAAMMEEMRAAGFDDMVAEAQRQIDEYFK